MVPNNKEAGILVKYSPSGAKNHLFNLIAFSGTKTELEKFIGSDLNFLAFIPHAGVNDLLGSQKDHLLGWLKYTPYVSERNGPLLMENFVPYVKMPESDRRKFESKGFALAVEAIAHSHLISLRFKQMVKYNADANSRREKMLRWTGRERRGIYPLEYSVEKIRQRLMEKFPHLLPERIRL